MQSQVFRSSKISKFRIFGNPLQPKVLAEQAGKVPKFLVAMDFQNSEKLIEVTQNAEEHLFGAEL